MKYSPYFKLWHWLNAVVVLGLLGTVFLRKTFLSWRTNSEILMTKLSELGVEITAEQAKILAKAIRAGMWEWHIILGYALSILILYRIVLYFTKSKKQEEFNKLSLHKKLVEVLYCLFYATLFFMAVSGLVLEFGKDLGMAKELLHDIKEIHEAVFYFIMYFTIIHLIGVIVAELRNEHGIISRMISQEKQ